MQEIKLSNHEKKEYYICTKVFSFVIRKHRYCSLFLKWYSSWMFNVFGKIWSHLLYFIDTCVFVTKKNYSAYLPDKISIFKIYFLHVDLALD